MRSVDELDAVQLSGSEIKSPPPKPRDGKSIKTLDLLNRFKWK